MRFPVACFQSLAEAACVSEARAGAEILMDGARGGHGLQLLLAPSQSADPAAPVSRPSGARSAFSLPFFTVAAFGKLRRLICREKLCRDQMPWPESASHGGGRGHVRSLERTLLIRYNYTLINAGKRLEHQMKISRLSTEMSSALSGAATSGGLALLPW